MGYVVSAARVLTVLACAQLFGTPLVLAQEEGGGVGGSLVNPEIRHPRAGPSPAAEPRSPSPRAPVERHGGAAPAIYSYPINTEPDGWAALKAEPSGGARRLTKVYDGTLFLVVGRVPGWKLVQFRSRERGWIAERLVGCCRPASQ